MKWVAPQLVTLGGVLAALLAMAWAPAHPYWAGVAVIAASLCDMIDGRVARALGAQSAFGSQLDSLSDLVAFGVAPAVLLYYWTFPLEPGFAGLNVAGMAAGFAFVACSAVRLARFNVAADSNSAMFSGIPTPVAAFLVTTPVMAWHEVGWSVLGDRRLGLATLVVAAVLMVAPLPFTSFKHFRYRATKVLYFGSMGGGVVLLAVGGPGGAVLLGLLGVYIVRGLAAGVAARVRGRAPDVAHRAP